MMVFKAKNEVVIAKDNVMVKKEEVVMVLI
jgi:hypothetical protein